MNNIQKTIDECRIQKVGDNMTITKTSNISLNIFDDKRFYVNNIKSYPHDESLYLFKRDLIKKICKRTKSVASQAGSLINTTPIELLKKLGLDVRKESLESFINNIKELTINDDRKLILAAITLYNDLL